MVRNLKVVAATMAISFIGLSFVGVFLADSTETLEGKINVGVLDIGSDLLTNDQMGFLEGVVFLCRT